MTCFALPVIDQDGRMVGIVTFDDAMDVMVDEATEDITKMAASTLVRRHILKHPFFSMQRTVSHGF